MTVTYVSSALNHHISPICEALYSVLGNEFTFIATDPVQDKTENLKKGYAFYQAKTLEGNKNPWYRLIVDEQSRNCCQEIIDQCDVVIIANTKDEWVLKRMVRGKVTFRAHERWFRDPLPWYRWLRSYCGGWIHHRRFRNLYMLCASAYTYADTSRVGCFRKKSFQWGYFPETRRYGSIDTLLSQKDKREILWCGRLLDWKHPDDALYIAKLLKDEGYSFHMTFVGEGELKEILKRRIGEWKLEECVSMRGFLDTNMVRECMESAGIYLFTSDFQEGWGAVLNEAMNSGCAVVASHAIGAAPYLIEDGKNGYLYNSGDMQHLYMKVKHLLDHPLEQKRLGEAAYKTIVREWNADIAAERFVKLAQNILNGEKEPQLYDDGPCTCAELLQNDWYQAE